MILGVMFGIVAAFFWGIGGVITKAGLEFVPAVPLLVMQLSVSVLLFWLVVILRKLPVAFNQYAGLASLGVLEPGLTYLFDFFGLEHTSASNATILFGTETFIIMALAVLLFRMRVSVLSWLWAGLGALGVYLVARSASSADGSWLGTILILAATFCAAFYVVLTDRFGREAPAEVILAYQQSIGLLVVFLSAPLLSGIDEFQTLWQLDHETWGLAIMGGLSQYFLAFWFYLMALKKIDVDLAGVILCITPIAGVGGAYLFLGEHLDLLQWFGGAITVLAVFSFAYGKYRTRLV